MIDNPDNNKIINYLENILPQRIIANNKEFKNAEIIKCTATSSESFNGFLSTIFQVILELQDKTSNEAHTLSLIAKLMKNAEQFREDARLDEMTYNELEFYQTIEPSYARFLKENGGGVDEDYVPRFYYGFYGFDEEFGISENPDGVFVFENLNTSGFRLGPRDKLDKKHILVMTEAIAKLHATSYAVKIKEPEKFSELVGKFKSFPFSGEEQTMFDPLYGIALERVYRHVTSTTQPEDFKSAFVKIYHKYINRPSELLQEFLDDDPDFNIIIHGDYNRNNVMFKYEEAEGFENPTGLKMFDFQWIKYASPVLDLSFYLYMNLDPEILESYWDEILKFYHETMMKNLRKILNCGEDDERLEKISFERFLNHFKKFAFYGCLITSWFLPIMLCDMESLPLIIQELNKDLFSDKSKEMCLPAGGSKALLIVMRNIEHAFKMGYMERLVE